MDALRAQLSALEPASRALDWDGAALRAALAEVADFGAGFLAELPDGPAFYNAASPAFAEALPEAGAPLADVLAEYRANGLPHGLNPCSGRFFGYVPGGGIPTAAVGDFLAALTNRYAGVYQASPGAAALENLCVRWLRGMVGFPGTAWGTLTSGGTLATLTAVVAARDSREPAAWPRSPVYMTAEVHNAAHRALHVAGLAASPVRFVRTDATHRMDVDHLASLVAADRAAGLAPWLVIASAGTVNSGAVDPLPALADLAGAEGLWLHVDGAYGGMFALTKTGAPRLAGLERADSVVLDPHKGLFLPYGCGAALVRDRGALRKPFAHEADYLADVQDAENASPADYSLELTRHFRALRLWVSLRHHGLAKFRAALEEKLLLARWACEELAKVDGIEVGPEPQLSIVTFQAASDAATAELLRRLLARGRVHLSSTRLGGRLVLRLCVLSFRSHLADVETAVAEVRTVLKSMA